ncbi:MAG TPA: hypothetical protein VMR74_08740 [Gammaproteobacteria bacterium]|nr:hypothetical protein [Gammaproteobacteria bacterium]
MRYPYLIGVLLITIIGVWWLLGEDPEARVREAHADLVQFLSKSEGDSDGSLSVLQLRALEALFAGTCDVSGDAEGLAGSYSPQELVGLIIRVRSAMTSVELQLGEITIEFPQEDVAVARFSASLDGLDSNGERRVQAREVESRMRDVDGAWQFVSFTLAER